MYYTQEQDVYKRQRILIDNGNTPAAPRPYIGHYGRLRKAKDVYKRQV